jgi:hypothetical protein
MARRRKKTKKPPSSTVAPKVDKSLPALPPNVSQAPPQFTPDIDTPSDIFSEPTTTDISPRPGQAKRNDSSPAALRRDASPASLEDRHNGMSTSAQPHNTMLLTNCIAETGSSNVYKTTNQSEADDAGDDSGIMLPFALDPNTAPGPSPNSSKMRTVDNKTPRDYFSRPGANNHLEMLKENRSRSTSAERQSKSPHTAYQEKGRRPSEQVVDTLRKRKETLTQPPAPIPERTRSQHAAPASSQPVEAFKLQEVPKNKRAEARKNSVATPSSGSQSADLSGRLMSPPADSLTTSPAPLDSHVRDDSPATSGSSYSSTQRVERPARGDSLANALQRPGGSSSRKEPSAASPTAPAMPSSDRKPSIAGTRSQHNGEYHVSSSMLDPPAPPQRSAGRPPPPPVDTFVSPRAPPQPPPPPQNHKAAEAATAALNDTMSSSGLPRYSTQGDFSMDEDFARLLGNQDGQEKEGGVLRRVSNAMSKHGRSFSDRGSINQQRGHKKWPTNGSIDISSPTIPSPDSKEESVNLRNELRRAQQKIAELEASRNELQETVHNAADLKQANTILREKRNTMAVLDTQREMVIRELEIMTDRFKDAKENSNSVDYNQMKSDVIKDFANALQKLKDQMGGQIEDLISKRTALTDEISNLIQMKDKGFQEYESLSAQNKKLSDMNQTLIESIQGTLAKNKQANGNNQSIDAGRSPANGLGIYHNHHKAGKSEISFENHVVAHEPSYNNLHENESEATLAQPQVVNIRKGKPTTKFSNWKKGGQAMKSVTKGFKGAFAASDPRPEDYNNVKVIGTPYGSTHSQPDFGSIANSSMASTNTLRGGGGKDDAGARNWFGAGGGGKNPAGSQIKPMQNEDSNANSGSKPPHNLFGSDLIARCEYEKRMIPAIVTRCIQEVEARGMFMTAISPTGFFANNLPGMDTEGIYRKSGGSSQVNQVKTGFEDSDEYDVSDPDLDIHAVTSALKGYLRKLPVPLVPYEIYDDFLAAGAQESNAAKAKSFHVVLKNLPKAHYDTLHFLIFHLSRIIQSAKDNLVSGFVQKVYEVISNNLTDDATQHCSCLCTNHHAARGPSARAERYEHPASCCASSTREPHERLLGR